MKKMGKTKGCMMDKDMDKMAKGGKVAASCGGKMKMAKGGGISQSALKAMGRNMAKTKAKS